MDTSFINSENSKTPKPHVLVLKLTNKWDWGIRKKVIILSNLSVYYTWKNIKSWYNNNKFKISAPTWNDEFELPNECYFTSDIQDYFEYILKKHVEVKAGNDSESLLNEIRQIVYCLSESKQITKKIYNSIIKSV